MRTQSLVASDPLRVGPYRVRGRLGSGGMGVVYLADTVHGEPVAVKCLPPGVSGEIRARLGREAAYLAAVQHRRVAHFVAADVRADRPWIAMQYVAGPSLAQAAVPLGPAQVRHLAEGLADALTALHRQRLVHRDVKPGNIILTHDGPVLVDLGIASGGDLSALTEVGMVVGTPEWMAPEQLGGFPTGPATDVWGWACVLTFAATGRTPFGSGPIPALAHRIRHDPPVLRGVPDWLLGAVTIGLTKDPRERPAIETLRTFAGIRAVSAAVANAAPHAAARPAAPQPAVPPNAVPPNAVPQPAVARPAVARPAVPPNAVPQSATARPAVARPAAPPTAVPRPAVPQPRVSQPRVSQPRVSRSRVSQSRVSQPAVRAGQAGSDGGSGRGDVYPAPPATSPHPSARRSTSGGAASAPNRPGRSTSRPMPRASRRASATARPTQAPGRGRSPAPTRRSNARATPVPRSPVRRSPVRGFTHSIAIVVIVLLLAMTAGLAGYVIIYHQIHGGSWTTPLSRLATVVRRR